MLGLSATAIALVAALSLPIAHAKLSGTCRNISLRGGQLWLYAECPDASGAYVKSSAFLGNWVTNTESVLNWQKGGSFHQSCNTCSLSGTTFSCSCRTTGGRYYTSSIDLDEHFVPKQGTIQSGLLGVVAAPIFGTVPVPDSFEYTEYPTWDANCTQKHVWYEENSSTPRTCISFEYYAEMPAAAAHFTVNPGWQLLAYPQVGCQGDLIKRITPSDSDKCIIFTPNALSISISPLWTYI